VTFLESHIDNIQKLRLIFGGFLKISLKINKNQWNNHEKSAENMFFMGANFNIAKSMKNVV